MTLTTNLRSNRIGKDFRQRLAISDNQGSANTGSTKIPTSRSPHPRLDTLLRHEDTTRARIALEAVGLIHLRIASLGKPAATVVVLNGPDATAP